MRVLVACEESQRVTLAFRSFGHQAFSCDLKDCSGGFPEYHIKGDCLAVIESNSWDLIIAHPPCTYLSIAGACNLVDRNGNIKDFQRYDNMLAAVDFFYKIYNIEGVRLCVENPRPMARCGLPPFSQSIQPFEFGDNFSKLTLLWLKNLPPLIGDCYSANKRSAPDCLSWTLLHSSPTVRSKTFNGIAYAMARQWGSLEPLCRYHE